MCKNNLYIECYSGISGDMMVASLLDLGADEKVLLNALESLNIGGFEIKIGRTKKCGIDACDFDVVLSEEYGYGHSHEHDHNHEHSNIHQNHDHNNDHKHEHHSHDHDYEQTHEHNDHLHTHVDQHRNIYDIYKIIDNSGITTRAKDIARKVFDVVAVAESKAHGLEINEVHFHEVGALDSIVDIVATAVCIDNLNIDNVYVSELYEGSGHTKCQHGNMPVPVPAVINIVSGHSMPIRITDLKGELVTPTGAAIAAALKTKNKLPEQFSIIKIGIGAGKKDFKKANILRTYLIEEKEKDNHKGGVWVLETNIDDSTGEGLAYTMEKLFEKGANDVFFTPIFMKKNRPAQMLKVICEEKLINDMESIIFKHTTTIGIRKYKTGRTVLKREIKDIETIYGLVRFKMCTHDGNEYYYPEYEDVKAICDKTGLSYTEVYKNITSCTI